MSHLVYPFLASIIYVFGALWLKRSGAHGVDAWLIALSSNVLSAIVFMILSFVLSDGTGLGQWWQAALTGACFVVGQTLAFAAFKYGDVSVATPVLGLKIMLVALFTLLMLGDDGSPQLWFGAVLASLGIMALSRKDGRLGNRMGLTLCLSFLGACGYAGFDVCLQKWARMWGVQDFLGATFLWVFILSLGFIPLVKWPKEGLGRGTRYLIYGSGAITIQSALVTLVIGYYGNATEVNVVYSLRGMWSVLVVWSMGHLFENSESQIGKKLLIYRGVGALAMASAVILVLL